MHEATLSTKLDKHRVQCQACNWRCTIADGKTGICGVRKNVGGKLQLMVYARPVSVHVDPMEKKPLYHFLPGTEIFSIGTVGCNLGCDFCQNFDISQVTKEQSGIGFQWHIKEFEAREELSPEQAVAQCVERTIRSVAFTYNEPTIFSEYAVDIMKLGRKHGLKGVYVSNGFMTKETLDFIHPYIDAFNIDLKSFSEAYYREVCHAKLQPVLENIRELWKRKKWVEVTTLLIPGKNDSDEELAEIAEFIVSVSPDIPWHLSAFFPTYKMLDAPATPPEALFAACDIGKEAGLRYVYTGNIRDPRHNHTLCHQCGTMLIERDAFYRTNVLAPHGVCPTCKTTIAGVWM